MNENTSVENTDDKSDLNYKNYDEISDELEFQLEQELEEELDHDFEESQFESADALAKEIKDELGDSIDFMPSAYDIQEEVEKIMKEKFGDKVKIVTRPISVESPDITTNSATHCSLDESSIEDDEDNQVEIKQNKQFDLTFDYRPKEIKQFLDKYVIKQDEAKKALAIAVCDHYNHVKRCHEVTQKKENDPDYVPEYDYDNYSKQNVLMLGPTGVGKTYLVRMIAKLIGVPFVKADATRFTETGYVGANVDDLVRDLYNIADENIDLAQYGIIYFDEADKLAGTGNGQGGKDISGRGVQYALLKLMEETEIDLRSSHDMISQMQAFMDLQRTGKVAKKAINTKHILFIVSGAFSGLDDIIKKRLKTRTIGIKSSSTQSEIEAFEKEIFSKVSTKDFINFGFEPEFIGRLPIRLSCQDLSIDDLYQILKNSEGSIIKQYIDAFDAYGISLSFEDCALWRIAELAHEEKTGARGLMTVCEKVFRGFKFELPSTEITSLNVTKELINNPNQILNNLLQSGQKILPSQSVRQNHTK